MAITLADFNKIWASTSPLTPYSFSESNYKQGWNFIGSTPPARQMWDYLQKNNDEKMQYLANNYLPLTGGTMTGAIISSIQEFIKCNVNNNHVVFMGGTSYSNSASLVLRGGDESPNNGGFQLKAQDGSSSKDFIGKPDGTLTWGGNNVLTDGFVGNTYSAAWTATTSSAYGTVLTDTLTNIPLGTYIAIAKLPTLSTGNFGISLITTGVTQISYYYQVVESQSSVVYIFNVTNATNTIKLISGSSQACDFSSLDRGSLILVRIA